LGKEGLSSPLEKFQVFRGTEKIVLGFFPAGPWLRGGGRGPALLFSNKHGFPNGDLLVSGAPQTKKEKKENKKEFNP